MASRWAERLLVVSVGRALDPKPVTLIYPYYQNSGFLADQCQRWWQSCPIDCRPFIKLIVVDDGSPEPAVLSSVPFAARLFRIEQDIPWNWIAARNIGAHHADDGWLLLTDMDHVIPAETFRSLVEGAHNTTGAYAFSRREHTGEAIAPHSASFLMTRQTFWRVGGYDETLSGHYGTDGDFRRRLVKVAPIHVLQERLVRHENRGDSSTLRYQRKLPTDTAAVSRLVKARGPHWQPKVLSFQYEEVTC